MAIISVLYTLCKTEIANLFWKASLPYLTGLDKCLVHRVRICYLLTCKLS